MVNLVPSSTDCETSTGSTPCGSVSYYFHPDHVGSSTFLSDENGLPYQFLLYLPFGETMAEQKAGGFGNRYKFNGKEQDALSGLYYYGARYYDPTLSIWHGVDPLASKFPDYSPYNYVLNNPIRLIDPDGRDVYDSDGNWIRGNTKEEGDWAYVQSGKTITSLGISESDFRSSAAIV